MTENFQIIRGTGPLILSIPHAGRELTPGLAERMTDAGRSLIDTDWWLERLYDLPVFKVLQPTIIRANLSRYVIDLNRDPAGASLYPGQATTELVPAATFDGAPIYRPGQAPDAPEILERTERYFWPYHQALAAEIARVKAAHGVVALYDCHSIRSVIPRLFDGELPVLNLGTNSGASCASELEARLASFLTEAVDYPVAINGRFKGGWITRHYGQPDMGVHAVQMELACRAYMSEQPPFTYDDAKASTLRTVLALLLNAIHQWAVNHQANGSKISRPGN